jgi:predicted amidophosphoribosyltransferase
MDLGNDGLLSPEAVADPPVYARARAVAHFEDGPVRRLVHLLKYSDRIELAKPLGAWMARAGTEILAEAEVLVPVPLHRRAGQADAIAVGLSRSQRALNLQGAFRVVDGKAGRIEGRAVVLIDDVMTSGATANAASRALLRRRQTRRCFGIRARNLRLRLGRLGLECRHFKGGLGVRLDLVQRYAIGEFD